MSFQWHIGHVVWSNIHSVGHDIWSDMLSSNVVKIKCSEDQMFIQYVMSFEWHIGHVIWTFSFNRSCHSNQMLSSNVVKITCSFSRSCHLIKYSFGRSWHLIWHVEFTCSEDQIFIQQILSIDHHSVGHVISMTYRSCRLIKYSFGRSWHLIWHVEFKCSED